MEAFWFAIAALLIGSLLTFAGYQFFRVLIPLFGFFAGFTWGAQAVALGLGEGFLATTTSWIIGFVVAIVVAALAYFFYELAVAVLAGAVGYWLVMGILTPLGMDGFVATTLAFVAAVALAILTVYIKAPKALLIVLSAFAGATAVIGGVLVMFGVVPVATMGSGIVAAIITSSFLWVVTWIVLAATGVATQLALSKDIDEADIYSDYMSSSAMLAGTKGGEVNKEVVDEPAEDVEIVEDDKNYDYPEKRSDAN